MPQPLKIFISSPGDVPDERLRAKLIIDKLSGDYGRLFDIVPYDWQYEPMLASGTFQDSIEPPSAHDIVILILWSRLGTPLPDRYHGLDGRFPVTGTEWEFEDALKTAKERGAPDILTFRNSNPAPVDTQNREARTRSIAQMEALESFWTRYFVDHGVFQAAFHEYASLEEFALCLEGALRKLIAKRIQSLVSDPSHLETIWPGAPFRGLEAYEFEHARIFFGRDGAVAKAAEQLAVRARSGTAFLLVSGPSGSGKSSLVKAALVPSLMKPQRISGAAFIRRVIFRPSDGGTDPIRGLVNALTRQGGDPEIGLPELLAPGQDAEKLVSYLRASPDEPGFVFAGALGRLTEQERKASRILGYEEAKLLLVIDQLEELFTLPGILPETRKLFARLLSGLARSGALWVVATIRSDFWHRAAEEPDLLALAEGFGRLDLAPPSRAELGEMISKPAEAAGLSFEIDGKTGIGLDGVLADHAASAPGVLPLLSFTLDALYEQDIIKANGRVLTYATYDRLGGLEGAIATRADECIASLPPSVQTELPRVLRALAAVASGSEAVAVARVVPLNEFPAASNARAVIDAMIAARLLVASDEGSVPTVRLAHEALITHWKRAKDQLVADRRDLETRNFIELQYGRWRTASFGEQNPLLLRDPDLASATDLEKRWGDELSVELRTYIQLSQRRAKFQHRLLVSAVVAFAALALGASLLGGKAYFSEIHARQAEQAAKESESGARSAQQKAEASEAAAKDSEIRAKSQQQKAEDSEKLTKQAQVQTEKSKQDLLVAGANRRAALAQQFATEGRPQLAAAIALDSLAGDKIQANKITPELNAALHRSLDMMRVPLERYLGDNVFRLALSPDGTTLAAGLAGNKLKGTVYILDAKTLTERVHFQAFVGDAASSLDFSSDGTRLLVAGDKIPGVWDVKTGQKLFDLNRPDVKKFAKQAKFSPDGKVIVVSTAENRALIYDSSNGKLLHILPGSSFEDMKRRLANEPADGFGVADPIIENVSRATWQIFGAATEIEISPDSKLVAVTGPANPDVSVLLFDVKTGRLVKTLTGGAGNMLGGVMGYGHTLAFSPDGSSLIAAPTGKTIKIWNLVDGRLKAQFPTSNVSSFFTDGDALTSVQSDGSLTFRCLSKAWLVKTVPAHGGSIDILSMNATGSLIATGSVDRNARVWRSLNSATICEVGGLVELSSLSVLPLVTLSGHGGRVADAVFTDGDETLVTASQDGWIRKWTIVPKMQSIEASTESERVISSDGDILVAGSGLAAKAWNTHDGQPIPIRTDIQLAVRGTKETGPILFRTPFSVVPFDGPTEYAGVFWSSWHGPVSPNGSRVIVPEQQLQKPDEILPPESYSDKSNTLLLVERNTKRVLAKLEVDKNAVSELKFSPDGSRLFGIVEHVDTNNKSTSDFAVWDSESGSLIVKELGLEGSLSLSNAFISSTGQRIAFTSDSIFNVSERGIEAVDSLKTSQGFYGPKATNSTLSYDGKDIVLGRDDGIIVVVDIDSKERKRLFTTQGLRINLIVTSSDGNYIAAVDASDTIWIFGAAADTPIRSIAFPDMVEHLEFFPDSDRLLVGGFKHSSIFSVLPEVDGQSDAEAVVSWAHKNGLNLASAEDRLRYKIGNACLVPESDDRRWAAIVPNEEGTSQLSWAATKEEASKRALASCQAQSKSCSSRPAVSQDLKTTSFIEMCCSMPKLGCAISPGEDAPETLRSLKETFAQAGYSACGVRRVINGCDGSEY